MTLQQIVDALYAGSMTWEAAEPLLKEGWLRFYKGDQNQTALQLGKLRNDLVAQGKLAAGPNVEEQLGGERNIEIERKTDPFTAYRARLGTAGKVALNPAEAYQEGLYDPLKNVFDVRGRMSALSSTGGGEAPTFSDWLNNLSGIGGAKLGYEQSANVLKDIYGTSPTQRSLYGTSYEPGQVTGEPGYEGDEDVMQRGGLGELQNLMAQALRTRYGSSGAGWAAGRLPQLQKAYYGQRALETGGSGDTTFMDWLKRNYPGMSF